MSVPSRGSGALLGTNRINFLNTAKSTAQAAGSSASCLLPIYDYIGSNCNNFMNTNNTNDRVNLSICITTLGNISEQCLLNINNKQMFNYTSNGLITMQ